MNDVTEIAVVLDRSGSMASVRTDAMGGFNSFLQDQKKSPRASRITLVQFDHEYILVHNAVPVKEVPLLDELSYVPRGMTALLDAIGRTIDDVGARLDKTPAAERPARVLVAILTDGLENASHDYSRQRIHSMITHQREVYSWEFIFLAANQDAVLTGNDLGLDPKHCVSTQNSRAGNRAGGQSLSMAASVYMNSGNLSGINLQRSYDTALTEEEARAHRENILNLNLKLKEK